MKYSADVKRRRHKKKVGAYTFFVGGSNKKKHDVVGFGNISAMAEKAVNLKRGDSSGAFASGFSIGNGMFYVVDQELSTMHIPSTPNDGIASVVKKESPFIKEGLLRADQKEESKSKEPHIKDDDEGAPVGGPIDPAIPSALDAVANEGADDTACAAVADGDVKGL